MMVKHKDLVNLAKTSKSAKILFPALNRSQGGRICNEGKKKEEEEEEKKKWKTLWDKNQLKKQEIEKMKKRENQRKKEQMNAHNLSSIAQNNLPSLEEFKNKTYSFSVPSFLGNASASSETLPTCGGPFKI